MSFPYPPDTFSAIDMYGKPNSVIASRGGCPFACYFCAVNNICKEKGYRSPEEVVRKS
jgi:radical SAM superfamily enzyme YgiQ (UPF0313 family)